ncbi:hypothetical protein ETI05_02220 [Macrococcoides canis]|uniref:Uncharacterized protein n=1 Tax=Macrococcoides canis TaxID=1855823 RepID=A0A4R6C7L2_9STAP|nr:hypothetical protein EST43_06750 [Macrococcus canis]TDM18379.1 hypothetical protein ETI04_02485 [Macrococcus canis]TDM21576.1 hypothetical protein ETI05_02220 [Macrococcus canis]TDM31716.1 hypothetical protein ETI03_05190 [Macrococcus canis]TDM38328.1 hypothetical protein ETI11_02740 [Macrococcus canis]
MNIYTYLSNQKTNQSPKNIKCYSGFITPYLLILLFLTVFFLSYYSSRFMLKLKTMDHLEQYYYEEILKSVEKRGV